MSHESPSGVRRTTDSERYRRVDDSQQLTAISDGNAYRDNIGIGKQGPVSQRSVPFLWMIAADRLYRSGSLAETDELVFVLQLSLDSRSALK